MKKFIAIAAVLAVVVGLGDVRADSGVSDPTISMTKFTPSGGKDQADKILASLESLSATDVAIIDVLDTLTAGTLTSGASVKGTYTAISTNDVTTNVLVTVDATIDGEYIAADTIDDDSIDFSDVTGADLTLTDCGAITSSGAIQGATLRLSATQYFAILNSTQLVFIAGSVTNIVDADIGTQE
jgi:hypothetical protein